MKEIEIRNGRIGATYQTEMGDCFKLVGMSSAGAVCKHVDPVTGRVSTHSYPISASTPVVEKEGVLFPLGSARIKGRHKRPAKAVVSKKPLSDSGDTFKF